MTKLQDLKRIMYENYNRDELIEYYQKKVIILNEIGASKQVIINHLQKIEQLIKEKEESVKTK